MQRQRLNDYMSALDLRQRVAKAVCKVLLVFASIALVLGWWWSLVSCAPTPQREAFDVLNQQDSANVWPQGCGKHQSEIPKLTER